LLILSLSVYNDGMSQSPLREPTFLILTALAEKPQHGYGIMVDVDHMSGGRVKLRPGTLMPRWTGSSKRAWSRPTAKRSWTAGCAGITGSRRPAARG